MDGPTAVVLRDKLALKSLDVVDETRAKWSGKSETARVWDPRAHEETVWPTAGGRV